MKDEAEMSAPMLGSVACRTFDDWYLSMELESFEPELRAAWDAGQSAARFTDAEREAVSIMADIANDPRGVAKHHGLDLVQTLRGLLERLK